MPQTNNRRTILTAKRSSGPLTITVQEMIFERQNSRMLIITMVAQLLIV